MARNKASEPSGSGRRNAKKDIVLGKKKKGGGFVLLAVVGVLIAGSALGWFISSEPRESLVIAQSPPVSSDDGSIAFPEAMFDDGEAKFFSRETDDGITIRYFVMKSSDGVVRAAFDACDVCWKAGKGYQQSGDVMICRNCGRRFPSISINEIKGGCNPAPLRRDYRDGVVTIALKDILEGRRYFDFSGRSRS